MPFMVKQLQIVRRGLVGVLFGALAALVFASSALAHTGEFAKFNFCPSTNAEVRKCLDSITNGGVIFLGKKETPISEPVTLQGGYGKPNAEHIAKFFEATNKITLSKTPQNVPGGLLGIVPPESSPPLVKLLSKFFFEKGITAVHATLELAQPASEIQLSEFNLLLEEGLALKLPVKVKLENTFLGSNCYVGSSSSPIIWNLTTGETSPALPNKTIKGTSGLIELKEEAEIAVLTGNELVENNWAAPTASGCGGILSFLVNPIINGMLGLPAKAGENSSAVLKNTINIASAIAVNEH
jgi:hypothetical protein